ncbi:MAG: hypothetical protein AAGD35_10350 [Actinomycetota bacterium]
MKLSKKWKWSGSGTSGCPALYDAPAEPGSQRIHGPGYVVQGLRLDETTRRQLDQLADDEDAVWVPADVIDRIKADA